MNVKETQSQETASGLLAESHTTRVQDCIEVEAESINSGQQKAPDEEFFGMSEEDIQKMIEQKTSLSGILSYGRLFKWTNWSCGV